MVEITESDRLELINKLLINTRFSNACWIYSGPDNGRGYGQISYKGNRFYVHRLSIALFKNKNYDSIEEAMHDDKFCKSTKCWNPIHLNDGNHYSNMRSARKHGKYKEITHCPKGHEYTPENKGIGSLGKRFCKICKKLADIKYRESKKVKKPLQNGLTGA